MKRGTYAWLHKASTDYIPQKVWLQPNRNLTLLHVGADQDGWEGEIITKDPIRGGDYRLAVPRAALNL